MGALETRGKQQRTVPICKYSLPVLGSEMVLIFKEEVEEVEEVTGKYFVDCKIEELIGSAKSDEQASKLWSVSSDLTGIDLNQR